MFKKLGPLSQFIDRLDVVFHSCIDILQDENPWNDAAALCQPSTVRACPPGLGEDVFIAQCIQFTDMSGEENFKKPSIPCANPVCNKFVGVGQKHEEIFQYCLICAGICGECASKLDDLGKVQCLEGETKAP